MLIIPAYGPGTAEPKVVKFCTSRLYQY